MTKIEKARVFAIAAHAAVGQVRKYTGEPYSVHPIEVASIVSSVPHTEAMLCAAFLHDVLEDTNVTEPVLLEEFGAEVTALVKWLTNVSTPEDGNRAARKEKDRLHLAQAPSDAQTIKLADTISNTPSILQYDHEFAKVYIPEKRALLTVLTQGNQDLWKWAHGQLI